MNVFRSTALTLAMTLAISGHALANNPSGDPMYSADAPRAWAMTGDLLIARPLLIATTLIGAGVFVVSLPFTALGGGVEEAADALIGEPGREAFVRCLGCTRSGYNKQDR